MLEKVCWQKTVELIVREVYDSQITEWEFGLWVAYDTMKIVWSQDKNPQLWKIFQPTREGVINLVITKI